MRRTSDAQQIGRSFSAGARRGLENQRLAFIDEYGDASLWADHQKSVTIENPFCADNRKARATYVEAPGWPAFTAAVRLRVQAREELVGRTVSEVFGG